MNDYYYNFQTVLERVPSHIEALCRELYPQGKKRSGHWCVGNYRGEPGGSFQISLKPSSAGCFIDRSDKTVHGNPISLVAINKGIPYQEAGEWLAKFCGVSPEERVFVRKTRKKPVIDRSMIKGLTKSSIDYAKSRGIEEATLRQLKIASGDHAIVFPHFDCDGDLVLIKFWPTDDSKKIWTNRDPVHTLFGKENIDPIKSGGTLIITEGQWDALTWIQIGYPAVSIPSGAGNDLWIEEDWTFLNLFTEIFLDFDDDEEGHSAEMRVRARLGYERCRTIRYNHKDANEVIKDGHDTKILAEAFHAAKNAPVEHIVIASDIRHVVQNLLSDTRESTGIPFFLSAMRKLEFRPHEATLWYGHTGHGKSTAIMNQFAFQAGLGIPGLIASFEDNSSVNYATLLKQFSANAFIGGHESFSEYYRKLTDLIRLFDSMRRTEPEVMIATMTLAHKQLGICHFAVDNVMTMKVDRQDNTEQAAVADMFRVFVSRYPVHLHLAAHPRKPQEAQVVRPPQLAEVRGASEWADMTQTAICVYRDVKKAERIAELYDEDVSREEIMRVRMESRDGKFIVRKQRTTGDHPICSFQFDQPIKRFWKTSLDREPYWYPDEDAEGLSAPDDDNAPPHLEISNEQVEDMEDMPF